MFATTLDLIAFAVANMSRARCKQRTMRLLIRFWYLIPGRQSFAIALNRWSRINCTCDHRRVNKCDKECTRSSVRHKETSLGPVYNLATTGSDRVRAMPFSGRNSVAMQSQARCKHGVRSPFLLVLCKIMGSHNKKISPYMNNTFVKSCLKSIYLYVTFKLYFFGTVYFPTASDRHCVRSSYRRNWIAYQTIHIAQSRSVINICLYISLDRTKPNYTSICK
jgi:hypothetical protein